MPEPDIEPLEEDRSNATVVQATDVPAGALYVAHGAVTARAIAGAVAARDPRRRAFLRHLILSTTLFVAVGIALVAAVAIVL